MIIYSEITNKLYNTVKECLDAENEYKSKKAERTKAYEELVEACHNYSKLTGKTYKICVDDTVPDLNNFIDLLFGKYDK